MLKIEHKQCYHYSITLSVITLTRWSQGIHIGVTTCTFVPCYNLVNVVTDYVICNTDCILLCCVTEKYYKVRKFS